MQKTHFHIFYGRSKPLHYHREIETAKPFPLRVSTMLKMTAERTFFNLQIKKVIIIH